MVRFRFNTVGVSITILMGTRQDCPVVCSKGILLLIVLKRLSSQWCDGNICIHGCDKNIILLLIYILDWLQDIRQRLITKALYREDIFVFPFRRIGFQFNMGKMSAIALAVLSNQNLGIIIPIFGSNPSINSDVLVKALQIW
ncbi:hypothetical protein Gogos_015413 [Gossypium gossypioides]|uniref:Cupin type-1 domain-containing protein n=1 Tax=Gossypium gossypioides TaxID=34282 RepID=A0A7J9C258_GOSGO|nr:hypothetical protein [Gossypium gossypioides]